MEKTEIQTSGFLENHRFVFDSKPSLQDTAGFLTQEFANAETSQGIDLATAKTGTPYASAA
jgi:hypothetical protein